MKKTYNHTRIIIWTVALWIYALLVYRLLDDDFSLPLVAIITFIPVLGIYFYLAKKEVADGASRTKNAAPGGLVGTFTIRIRDIVESFISIVAACVLAVATVALFFDPSLKRELSSPWTNCARDASRITTLPVNQTLDYTDAKITVHNVTYNVPQNSEHPTAYGYECEKAALVQVTIEPKNIVIQQVDGVEKDDEISLIDFSLGNKAQDSYAWSEGPDSTEEYDYYAANKNISFIDNDIAIDSNKVDGWLVFSVREDNSNQGSTLTYGKYADKSKPSIALPEPTQ